jgi:fused signal recognition particle receptor
MLGWFKKKFGKTSTAPGTAASELSEAAVEEIGAPLTAAQTATITPTEAEAAEAITSADLVADAVEAVFEEAGESAAEEAVVDISAVAVEQDADLPIEETEASPLNAEPAVVVSVGSEVAPTQEKPASKSMFQRLQERLGKTRDSLVYRLDRLFLGKKEIDQELFEQLEEILITADLGVATTLELLDIARKKVKRDQLSDPQALKTIIRDQIQAYIEATDQPAELVMPAEGPFVIMVVGVNGVGKTTTIGKMAAKFAGAGQSVLLVAGDTFRAAAINQLKIWGERVGVEVIAQNPGADPSSVVFDGLEYGVAHRFDVIIIDTAGRLHTSVNLMAELKKIKRVIGKKMEGAPHEIMLVLDATTGQNGIAQAKFFHEAVGVSGLTLTKLDGTAKGGIVANICREIRIPVRFIGIGEQVDDLRDFDAREFVDALFAQ